MLFGAAASGLKSFGWGHLAPGARGSRLPPGRRGLGRRCRRRVQQGGAALFWLQLALDLAWESKACLDLAWSVGEVGAYRSN